MSRQHHSGFTLLDLLIACAILGVLYALAIPKINQIKARANQAQIKTELTTAYAAERTFYQMYKAYSTDFPTAGYVRTGMDWTPVVCPNPKTGSGFRYAVYLTATIINNSWTPKWPYSLGSEPPGISPLYACWDGWAYPATAELCPATSYNGNSLGHTVYPTIEGEMGFNPPGTASIGPNTFQISAMGCPFRPMNAPEETKLDLWRIDDSGALKQMHAGTE